MTQAEVIAHEERVARNKLNKMERFPSTTYAPDETSESDLHGKIMQHCKTQGWICFHGTWGKISRRSPGEPDFTLMLPGGRVLFMEIKTKIGKLSTEQLGMKLWAEKLGHQIHTVRSFEQFLELTK